MEANPIYIGATIISLLIAAFTQWMRWRDESKKSEAEFADLVTDSARAMIETANAQEKKARDAHLAAVQASNTLKVEKLKLERNNAGLIHEVKHLRTGVEILTEQIKELDAQPRWDVRSTKPLFTSAEVEEILAEILRNGKRDRSARPGGAGE